MKKGVWFELYRFRPLKEEDRSALRQLVSRNKDIPLKWRNKYVIKYYSSGIHVVTCYNKVVGMVHIGLVNKNEAWLESAYIEPKHRGKGVGTAFASYQIKQARYSGASVLRVATGYKNTRVQHVMVNKLRFSRPILWYRIKVNARSNRVSVNPFIHQAEPGRVGEYWSYLYHNSEFRKTTGIITSPRDNCWWGGLDYDLLESILNGMETIAYAKKNNIKGMLLVKNSKGMNFNCPAVLQGYYNSNKIFRQMLQGLLATNKTVYLSVSKDPARVLSILQKEGVIKTYSANKWVIMEKHL